MAANTISPKVTSGANWAAYATFTLTLLNSISPDMLTGLGKWEPLVNGVIVAASYFLGAYLKEDPLRTAGLAAQTDTAPAPVVQAPVAPVVAQAVAAVEPFIPAALQKLAQAPAPAPETPSV